MGDSEKEKIPPAIKTAEGTSFKDAVSMMSDIEVANNTKTDIKPANTTETVGKNAESKGRTSSIILQCFLDIY